jgi:hypothetical protein
VSSNSQIGPNTVSGSKRPSGFANDNIANGSVDTSDLAPTARSHRLEYHAVDGATETTIATISNVRLSAKCASGGLSGLTVYATNTTGQLGTINNFFTSQTSSNGPVALYESGEFIAAGAKHTVDRNDADDEDPIASASFNRVEGQVVFQTPGRVTTIEFHGDHAGGQCHFFGSSVTASQS